ncbi:uncharacterized protein LOC122004604 [Zingiber officinale]|uniref:Uncharacterized protein n=1 Tax=Zingiber officinale TaxID=94328 RepID=A0A8J5G2U2_ZINOF|nr:uncharacterized protein LOC122004604 [Zingiber officinale]KAG6490449.1 hypothetical protein ZIOFF_051746 [Zingiber officinale]
MSLNCLSCGGYESPSPKRKASSEQDGLSWMSRCCGVDRSWSGNLTPPPPPAYGTLRSGSAKYSSHGGGEAREMGQHRRIWSTGSALMEEEMSEAEEPRLVRSRGMRREWSFEDVQKSNTTNRRTSAANNLT